MKLEHGKRWTYLKRGCRCDACRAANAAYQFKRKRSTFRAKPSMPKPARPVYARTLLDEAIDIAESMLGRKRVAR